MHVRQSQRNEQGRKVSERIYVYGCDMKKRGDLEIWEREVGG